MSSGSVTLSLTNQTAGIQTVSASDVTHAGIGANTGSATTVNPGAFTKLQLLVPGETAVPGTTTGKIGTPITEISNLVFTVTVNSVDATWNQVITNDTIRIRSSDTIAVLPASNALVAGTQVFSVTLNTVGTNLTTITASNVTHTGFAVAVSPLLTVNAKLAQTITFGPLADKIYGAPPLVPRLPRVCLLASASCPAWRRSRTAPM
jgi:hypothetical protein